MPKSKITKPQPEANEPCPLSICDGSGVTVINAGMCGACEICRDREETEVPCPHLSKENVEE